MTTEPCTTPSTAGPTGSSGAGPSRGSTSPTSPTAVRWEDGSPRPRTAACGRHWTGPTGVPWTSTTWRAPSPAPVITWVMAAPSSRTPPGPGRSRTRSPARTCGRWSLTPWIPTTGGLPATMTLSYTPQMVEQAPGPTPQPPSAPSGRTSRWSRTRGHTTSASLASTGISGTLFARREYRPPGRLLRQRPVVPPTCTRSIS